jgi:type I restriction enzyme M protein
VARLYGQENNATNRRLAVMNLALRGIEPDFGPEHADTFRRDLHRNLCAASGPATGKRRHA